jgi:molecular chaperone GrpE
MRFGRKKPDDEDAGTDASGAAGTAPPAEGIDPSVPLMDAEAMADLIVRAAERDGLQERLLRMQADLDNVRRRESLERRRAADEDVERVLAPVLEMMDTFSRAVNAAAQSRDLDALLEGVRLATRELERGLGDAGVRRIEAVGQTLDPSRHRAVFQEPTADVPPMTVMEVFAAGWIRGDRVLRPAMVKVSTSLPSNADGSSAAATETPE